MVYILILENPNSPQRTWTSIFNSVGGVVWFDM